MSQRLFLSLVCAITTLVATHLTPSVQADGKVTLHAGKGKVTVDIDGKLFTEYVYEGYEKPILYPVIGPYGIRMTRDYPMREGVTGEAKDHPHHKSIWFGHMKVNNESFWHVGKTAGTTEQTELVSVEKDTVKTTNRLVARDGKTVVATDSRTIRFGQKGETRWIDYSVTYHATMGDIKFGDNKDGQMGIRMNPQLRLKGPVAKGQAVNSAGDTSAKIWGKRAKWIDYWGEVDGHQVGIAIFDHPSNLRHPTWWHARDYGLLSANPFGIHHFEGKKDPVGEYTLKKDESLTFRHLFLFHKGDPKSAHIGQMYDDWVKSP
ncbi:MAG: hypothetical protein CL681_18315 [Blastopirellula sp.]|nr:hypothetical protein [Blastopirellula sp.]